MVPTNFMWEWSESKANGMWNELDHFFKWKLQYSSSDLGRDFIATGMRGKADGGILGVMWRVEEVYWEQRERGSSWDVYQLAPCSLYQRFPTPVWVAPDRHIWFYLSTNQTLPYIVHYIGNRLLPIGTLTEREGGGWIDGIVLLGN